MNIQKDSTRRVVDRCKKLRKKIVGGGPLFSTDSESFDDVDHLLLYEGEACIPEFLCDLENDAAKHIYDFKEYPDMSETPAPAWELINLNNYAMLSIQYSRGCPFNCEFCNVVSLFGHNPRTKTADQIIGELESIYRLGWRGRIFFVDDNLIGNKNKLKQEILPAIIKWLREKNHPFSFYTEVSINIADDEELMNLMTEAGFDSVFIGIETVNEEGLAEANKKQNLNRDLVETVKRIQRFGLQVLGGFILGFDSDKPSVFSDMIDFIQRSGIVTAMVGLLNAPKGTKLFERMKREERLSDDEFTGSNEAGMNFTPIMEKGELLKGYQHVVRTIYTPKIYYARVRIFLENFRPKKQKRKGSGFGNAGAFLKSCLHLGIISEGRLDYWKILGWSLMNGMSTFSQVVKFSIYGYHFYKCVNES